MTTYLCSPQHGLAAIVLPSLRRRFTAVSKLAAGDRQAAAYPCWVSAEQEAKVTLTLLDGLRWPLPCRPARGAVECPAGPDHDHGDRGRAPPSTPSSRQGRRWSWRTRCP